MKQVHKDYDAIIIGGGVVGCALTFILSEYTNLSRIALIEKRSDVGELNSHKNNNSQTLHFGDIETHYSVDRSKEVKRMATLLKCYLEKFDPDQECYYKSHKMVIAIGKKQVKKLKQRFEKIKDIYPDDRLLLSHEEIAEYEPKVVEGRDPKQPLAAIWSPNGYAVNYGLLAKHLIETTQNRNKIKVDVFLNTKVKRLSKQNGQHVVETNKGTFGAKFIEVAAAAYSLYFARQYGLGKDWVIINMAGNFYCAPPVLNGKVYRMQISELPFAAVHGDPEVTGEHTLVRFGPSAKAVFMMERGSYNTVLDYFRLLGADFHRYLALLAVLMKPVYLKFVIMNLLYDIPYIGKRLFLRQINRVVPSLTAQDIWLTHAGVRPQIIDTRTRKPKMGSGKLYNDRIIFNVTPSPGASVCLGSAEEDVKKLMQMAAGEIKFEQERFERELLT